MLTNPVEARLLSSKCCSSIEAAREYFTIEMGQVSVQPESTIWSILASCFARFVNIFALDDCYGVLTGPDSQALARMVHSIFDTNSRAFVSQDCPLVLEDGQARARLLAQALAGLVLIFRRLPSAGTGVGKEVTHGSFSRQLQLFAESEQRRDMLAAIDSSHVFGACGGWSELVALMTNAAEGNSAKSIEHGILPLGSIGKDLLSYDVAWISDRPCSNMGLPWGFTIMAVN